ncbi:MAG: 3-deoxy-7-phosphoheptulonate synthase [Legionellales bacterium]|nr:3-deoxy-7-phosphoheptulonate synthase [Legionellales bacterium]
MLNSTDDLRIGSLRPLISPAILMEEFPLTDSVIQTITQAREQASDIIHGKDDRLLVIVGPCSIHDPDAALAYAALLAKAQEQFADDLLLIMRVYFEKPRTTVGWKGLINDPELNNTFNINHGLKLARKLLLELNQLGVPAATEFLDTIIPQFICDLVAWGAIGARTTESQIHRELASGLSMPVGFKNGTDGNTQIAIDAIGSSFNPHHFLSVTKHGIPAIVSTTGNPDCHVILRGSKQGTNYQATEVSQVSQQLTQAQLNPHIMIDCSHGNSQKDHTKQAKVTQDISQQLSDGNQTICGVMLESNLVAGQQKLEPGKALTYGQSITDACISWDETLIILQQLAHAIQQRRKPIKRSSV